MKYEVVLRIGAFETFGYLPSFELLRVFRSVTQ